MRPLACTCFPTCLPSTAGSIREVQISVYRNFSRKILERVEDGSVDVGIVSLPVKSHSIKVHSIFRDQLMVMVSSRNPLAKQKSVTVEEVAKQPLIFPKTGYTRQALDKLFRPYRAELADQDGIAQRGHDQALRGRRHRRLAHQRQLRQGRGALAAKPSCSP